GAGDLTRRKLFPAIYELAVRNMLPERFALVGVSRTELTDEEFRAQMKDSVEQFGRDKLDGRVWKRLAAGMRYVPSDVGGAEEGRLFELLAKLDEQRGTGGNRVFYLAVPPTAFSPLVAMLGQRRAEWSGWTRLIVEKPFGHDRASARALNDELLAHFEEREIYRIDHYLGKETVQNLLALRFANGIF